ncbi:Cof-type HAD-IIB family hydrolase [Sinanaerobacter chloroacetimidivorans]|uniref:HAD family phosphatase n=1 Tax=Sinanaerobacter chloroacetimidivorans TaxID=2818044 RepID=A0A8J8B327_9FIRM|nr:Cof-type HAD-IIB family hydrolase [Sinanaerobacter chloroacetimidivorans]MBR0597880.1 HAD family phosphatase [Sinanaerobacter chloroacetimidivorans]
MYKLIVSDMDGTLLRDDHSVSEYTKSIIQRAAKNGTEFMLATGRIYGGARRYSAELGLNTPILACNGALIKEAGGRKVYGKPIASEALSEVFQFLTDKGLYFHFYGEECFYTEKFSPQWSGFYQFNNELPEDERFPMMEVNPFQILDKDEIYKVLVHCEEEERGVLYSELTELPGISVTSSWYNSFDICAEQVSKANAIEKYAKGKNILPSEIMCFGDNFNDIDMIQFAGLGVAVENAVPKLKELADYVTGTNNQDGVARAIEKFLFE